MLEVTRATVTDLAWLEGGWRGTQGDDPIEEWWSAPGGDSLMGMFRWLKDGKVYLYELMGIVPSDVGLIFKIKHFNAGFVGWEEKDQSTRFLIESINERGASFLQQDTRKFVRLVYRREAENRLVVRLEHTPDGRDAVDFYYQRVK